ncbi:MAG: FAD binding domain-containing protein [Niameybacter sp.]|uniref:FAD binding domain-containing protein n=1 Tax=Niameybacter sp. TaxID=2033640 RepID=UPI002FC6DDCE
MFTINNYVVATSLEEAYTVLTKNKSNKILGGTLWMRMGSQNIHTAIDLSKLGLDTIVETKEAFEIGAMCTLRMLELHPGLQAYGNGMVSNCVKDIVGVQFRNGATIGGSLFSRFGFSDPLTALLALDTYVELYKGGTISLEAFIEGPYEKDILIKIIIKKEMSLTGVYLTERLSHTDFPVLAVAMTQSLAGYKVAIGARPSKAALAHETMDYLNTITSGHERSPLSNEQLEVCGEKVVEELNFATNMRGSQHYREHLAKVLVKRGLRQLRG